MTDLPGADLAASDVPAVDLPASDLAGADLAVVGLGLIGSAALRHAAAVCTVLGIGPAEPKSWSDHRGPFASHYDSGRITRGIDARAEWARLAGRSIAQYPLIEQAGQGRFHNPAGVVFVRNDRAGIDNVTGVAAELGLPVTVGPVRDYESGCGLAFPPDWTAIREGAPAGAIDPLVMVEAQQRAAVAAGARLVRDTVLAIRPVRPGFELATASGRVHRADRVLVAAGAYSNQLLQRPLSVGVRPEVVVLGELAAAEAQRLSAMPSVLYLLDHPELDDVYVVPPRRYPDGRFYIKIGGSRRNAELFTEPEQMNDWMRSERCDRQLPALRGVLQQMLPEVDFLSWHAKPCLITDTPSGLPYVDQLEPGLTVAFAGNGHAAKSADAIGALATELALADGVWPDQELDARSFAARFEDYAARPGSRHGN